MFEVEVNVWWIEKVNCPRRLSSVIKEHHKKTKRIWTSWMNMNEHHQFIASSSLSRTVDNFSFSIVYVWLHLCFVLGWLWFIWYDAFTLIWVSVRESEFETIYYQISDIGYQISLVDSFLCWPLAVNRVITPAVSCTQNVEAARQNAALFHPSRKRCCCFHYCTHVRKCVAMRHCTWIVSMNLLFVIVIDIQHFAI